MRSSWPVCLEVTQISWNKMHECDEIFTLSGEADLKGHVEGLSEIVGVGCQPNCSLSLLQILILHSHDVKMYIKDSDYSKNVVISTCMCTSRNQRNFVSSRQCPFWHTEHIHASMTTERPYFSATCFTVFTTLFCL